MGQVREMYKSCQTNDYEMFGVLFEINNDRGQQLETKK